MIRIAVIRLNNIVISFDSFYEDVQGQLPFTPKTIKRGLGVDVPKNVWYRIERHTPRFNDRVSIKQYNVWSDSIDANELFIRKTHSLTAIAMGYGKEYDMPTTTISVFYPEQMGKGEYDYSGAHSHQGNEHEIELNLEDIFYHDGIIQRYFCTLIHEMAHSLQVTLGRLKYGHERFNRTRS